MTATDVSASAEPQTVDAPTTYDAKLAAAVVAALADLEDLKRDQTATVETRGGGSYSYSYTDLAGVCTAVRPVLARHGLAVFQPVFTDVGKVTVWTVILHTSGATLESPPLVLRAGDSPQAVGSAITYARRYSLLATLGLATEDDNGGHASQTQTPPARRPRQTTRPQSDDDRQRALAMALANDLDLGGPANRQARLDRWSQILGREVTSWNDLDGAERSRVITVMRADLEGGEYPDLYDHDDREDS